MGSFVLRIELVSGDCNIEPFLKDTWTAEMKTRCLLCNKCIKRRLDFD